MRRGFCGTSAGGITGRRRISRQASFLRSARAEEEFRHHRHDRSGEPTASSAKWTATPCDAAARKRDLHARGAAVSGGKLDFDACKAFIRRVDVGYYTDANLNVTLSLLDKEKEEEQDGGLTALGEIRVSTLVTMFKKIRLDTHETLGFGHVRLPETEMHTTAMWWTLPDTLAARFESDTLKNGMMGVANLLADCCAAVADVCAAGHCNRLSGEKPADGQADAAAV